MNRLVLPRKRVKRGDPKYKYFQYFYQGNAIGEIKVHKGYGRNRLKEKESSLFATLRGDRNG